MPSRVIRPIEFTVREARIIEDQLVDRRAVMTVVDREDTIVAIEIDRVLRKIAEAMQGVDVKRGAREKLPERMTAADLGIAAP